MLRGVIALLDIIERSYYKVFGGQIGKGVTVLLLSKGLMFDRSKATYVDEEAVYLAWTWLGEL